MIRGRTRGQYFVEFESEEQFAPEASLLANRAADEVTHFRSRFPDLHAWADLLAKVAGGHFWLEYDAAVAHGLVGAREDAQRWFALVNAYQWREDSYARPEDDWLYHAQLRAAELEASLDDEERFLSLVDSKVKAFRSALRLEPEVSLANRR